jgi:hypothetical protein
VPVLLELPGELAGEGRLARALEAGQHDDRGRVLGELQSALLTAEDRDELFVDDLHDLLGRVEGPVDLVAEGALAHLRREVLDDDQRHVGIQQGAPDLADGPVDIGGRELALRAKVAEGLCQPVAEGAESRHDAPILRESSPALRRGLWSPSCVIVTRRRPRARGRPVR